MYRSMTLRHFVGFKNFILLKELNLAYDYIQRLLTISVDTLIRGSYNSH